MRLHRLLPTFSIFLLLIIGCGESATAAEKKSTPLGKSAGARVEKPVEKPANSALRITCDDESEGADIYINEKFKGQCPLDMVVPEGEFSLSAKKQFNTSYTGSFEREIRIGDGVIQKVTVVLVKQLTEEGRALLRERNQALLETYERETAAYDKALADFKASVENCVQRMYRAAEEKEEYCYKYSGGCVGPLFCEEHEDRVARCAETKDRNSLESACSARFKKPAKPVRPQIQAE